jgi:hypothetical protein
MKIKKGHTLKVSKGLVALGINDIHIAAKDEEGDKVRLVDMPGNYNTSFFDIILPKDLDPAPLNKYDRVVYAKDGDTAIIDVYRVLAAFNVCDPSLQHLTKKALCTGIRGHKSREQDLRDIVDSAKEALELFLQKKEQSNNP